MVFRDPRALHVRYVFLLPVYLLFVARGGMALGAGAARLATPGGKPAAGRPLVARAPYLAALSALALVSLLFLPDYYQRTKPDWRAAAAFLTERTIAGDVIVTGPLFDVGRYLDYYYDGPAELMPPALLVAGLPERLESMRQSGGRVWAVTRFRPAPAGAVRHVEFPGLTVSEPLVAVYEPEPLTAAMVDLMQQAVAAAPDWAARMSVEGVLDPDPRVARAAAYLFLGDVYQEAGRLPEAAAAYEGIAAAFPQPGGYVRLAEAYEAAGMPEQAVAAYRRAVQLNRAWQGPRTEQAARLADAGRWSEAAAAFRAIVK
jgi:tetratricopeptide (TPR) repeat protein